MGNDQSDAFVGKKEYELHDLVCRNPIDQCLEWDGCVNQSGVPYMKFRGRRIVSVKRLIYAWLKGGFPSLPWSGSAYITSKCGNQRCINPHHLEEK